MLLLDAYFVVIIEDIVAFFGYAEFFALGSCLCLDHDNVIAVDDKRVGGAVPFPSRCAFNVACYVGYLVAVESHRTENFEEDGFG